MYSAHNEGKSVVAERFIKTLMGKICKKMTANDSKSYLSYLNKLIDQYNNTYHSSIGKKPIYIDYPALNTDIESSHKTPKFKVGDRGRSVKYKNIFSKGHTENWSREIFVIDSVLKNNQLTYKIKDLTGEKIIRSFMKKNCG